MNITDSHRVALIAADGARVEFIALAQSIRRGHPLDPRTEMGPLTSRLSQQPVLSYLEVCRKEGNRILTGGGVGQSGYGCYLGTECMHEYSEAQSPWINDDAPIPPCDPR